MFKIIKPPMPIFLSVINKLYNIFNIATRVKTFEQISKLLIIEFIGRGLYISILIYYK